MILTPASVLKQRLARNWCKMQSVGRWDYILTDVRVINNKPHIKLTTVPQKPQYYAVPYD